MSLQTRSPTDSNGGRLLMKTKAFRSCGVLVSKATPPCSRLWWTVEPNTGYESMNECCYFSMHTIYSPMERLTSSEKQQQLNLV